MSTVFASGQNIFLCMVADAEGKPVAAEQRSRATRAVRKKYPPCYSDSHVTIFSTNDALPTVAAHVTGICKDFGVGSVVIEIDQSRIESHGVDMRRCFGDASSSSSFEVKAPGTLAREYAGSGS
jgi:hypothetical protein